jgi:hypothetical protein
MLRIMSVPPIARCPLQAYPIKLEFEGRAVCVRNVWSLREGVASGADWVARKGEE